MNVKLESLSLTNFKGIRNLKIEFKAVTRIYGDNATGKTTVVDAFTWLLFGKDSADRKDFEIKTLDEENNVIHKLDHEVTGVLLINNVQTTIRRCYREKWVTRRGSETPELQGHETTFFWNDVPLQAGEYQDKIDSIIRESTFKLITSPMQFNAMKWQDRRQILVSIAGDVSDNLLATTEDFKDLLARMEGKTFDEYRKELTAKKKKLKDELALIPARIDEQERSKPEPADWKAVQDEIDILKNNIDKVDEEIADESKKYQGVANDRINLQKQINDLKMKISNLEFKARQEFQNLLNIKQAAIDKAKNEITTIDRGRQLHEQEKANHAKKINDLTDLLSKLREKWASVNEETVVFNPELFVCPTCQRELEQDDIDNKQSLMLQNFNDNKSKKLKDIEDEGKRVSEQLSTMRNQQSTSDDNWGTARAEAEKGLKEAEAVEIISVQAILQSNQEYVESSKKLSELESQPIPEVPEADNRQLKLKRSGYQDRIDVLNQILNRKSIIEAATARIDELSRQEKSYAQQLAEFERLEYTMQQFIKAKVDFLEERINGMFSGVKFRLFDTQLNGGIVECCDTLINGVPWQSANNAARINAGIEIINVLSDHYQVNAPIFIDNAESITQIQKSLSQMIELYVSIDDKTLRVN